MKVIDRIHAFLNDRPVRSDATGMFIERDDLRKLLEEIGETAPTNLEEKTQYVRNMELPNDRCEARMVSATHRYLVPESL